MIKVSFQSANAIDDVLEILESNLTNQIDVEKWINEKIPTMKFDSMDFLYDLESFYDCYFESSNEKEDAHQIYYLLEQNLRDIKQVVFSVFIVDARMKIIKKIEE